MLGIAIDKGFIESVNDPIFKYLKYPKPEKNLSPLKDSITIKHLLTMSTGLECNDFDKSSKGQEDRVYKKRDWIQYTLDLPMVNAPGEVSNYCSMGTVILAEIISQASGMSIDQFTEQYLFEPLGIKNVFWKHTSKKEVISAAKRLHVTSRDMAKIGLLVLNKGEWQGKRIVSEEWIKESTTPSTTITGLDYGYLWWDLPFKKDDVVVHNITATGNGGQYIIIVPTMNMIAVFTGGAYNSEAQKIPFMLLNNILLPMFE